MTRKTWPVVWLAAVLGCQSSADVMLETAGDAGSPEMAGMDPFLIDTAPSQAPIVDPLPGCGSSQSGPPSAPVAPPQGLSAPAPDPSRPLPPPISGGTLLATADGSTLVAADPDRDQLHFVDALGMRHLYTRALNQGDEPGRVVEDAAGRIHVVLRGAGAIATLDRAADSVIARRPVCALPRGIAYDAASDQLHVACAEGKLLSLGAAPSELMPSRTLELGPDLRDVLVRGDQLFVTRFRAAELLVLNREGVLLESRKPQAFAHSDERPIADPEIDACASDEPLMSHVVRVEMTPNVAWRMIDVPGRGVSLLHQRSHTDEVKVTAGGYGDGSCDTGIVLTSVTLGLDTEQPATVDFADLTVAVDFAVDPDGALLVVIAPGNHGGSSQLDMTPLDWFDPAKQMANGQSAQFPTNAGFATGSWSNLVDGRDVAHCTNSGWFDGPLGQATALAFTTPYMVAVQEREPAAISFFDLRTEAQRARVELGGASHFDTGHAIFHARTRSGAACASCHPEGGDDGHVWSFVGVGPRRTQTLRGGLLGTEPLHWSGDMADFRMLVDKVFVERMAGFTPSAKQVDALAGWLDRLPALRAPHPDAAAAERGRVLFESPETRCAQCHSGPHLTNNRSENVGTGADLQVPSLKGLKFRTPLMHDGCAATISERFTNLACGGGDKHGMTSQLTPTQVSDLTAYLETL